MVLYPEVPVLLSLRWHDEKWLASQTAEQRAQYDLNPFHSQTLKRLFTGKVYFNLKFIIIQQCKEKEAYKQCRTTEQRGQYDLNPFHFQTLKGLFTG